MIQIMLLNANLEHDSSQFYPCTDGLHKTASSQVMITVMKNLQLTK